MNQLLTPPLFLSLLEQRDLLRRGEVSSYELTKSYVERIQALNGDWNIVIRDDFPTALRRAHALDEYLRTTGQPVGPLHGVPFTIKDAFRIKGFGTSHGFPGVAALLPATSCTLVDRLLAAGAVFLGQTNVPFACFDWQTSSPSYGLTRNPLDRKRTVGGSSGGSAASVAAFFSPFEVGADVAGSIRYPAHCCGVYGLRPTHGWVPCSDVGPPFHPELLPNLLVAGPLARSIEDLKLVLAIITAEQGGAKPASAPKLKLKLAYTLRWTGIVPDEQSDHTIRLFIKQAQQQGHELTEVVPPVDFQRCTEVYGIILGYEFKQVMPAPFRFRPFMRVFNHFFNTNQFRAGLFKESFQQGLLGNRQLYEHALASAGALRESFFAGLHDFNLWLTPVAATAAIPHQKTGTWQMLHGQRVPYATYLSNFLLPPTLFHHPILTAPLQATPADFPIGVQLHGKPGQDWQLLHDCAQLAPLFARSQPPEMSGQRVKPAAFAPPLARQSR